MVNNHSTPGHLRVPNAVKLAQQPQPMPRMPTQGPMPGMQPQGRPQPPIGPNGPNTMGGAFGQAGSQPAPGYGQNPFQVGNAYGSNQNPGMAMGYGQQEPPGYGQNPSLTGQVFGQLANQGQWGR